MPYGPTKTPMWVKAVLVPACIGAAYLTWKG